MMLPITPKPRPFITCPANQPAMAPMTNIQMIPSMPPPPFTSNEPIAEARPPRRSD